MILQVPSALLESLKQVKGFDKEAFEAVHHAQDPLTSIRFNPNKKIQNPGFKIQDKIPWSSQGYYLLERPSFTADPLFHSGAYYVQEASSMFVEEMLRQSVDLFQPLKVLDLCAAPGGKSTLLQSVLSANSLLVSNETIKARVAILSENSVKWGAVNVVVTNNDPKDFQRLENYFDVVLVDAPCSGSGLFRKDNEAVNEWSEANVNLCSQRQQRILADVLPALKPNGILIYATCSYSKEEDEMISDWLMQHAEFDSIKCALKDDWGIVETESPQAKVYGYRFFPNQVKGEGFFIAGFRRKKNEENTRESSVKKFRINWEKANSKEAEIIRPFLKSAGDYIFIKFNEEILAIPVFMGNELHVLQNLYIKKIGVKIGTVIRDEVIPHHELAMAPILNEKIPAIEVDESTALQYLRKQEIKLDTVLKDWSLLVFQGIPLGWIKILQGRINNYYPKEWRILNK